jgi:hypothetical protein
MPARLARGASCPLTASERPKRARCPRAGLLAFRAGYEMFGLGGIQGVELFRLRKAGGSLDDVRGDRNGRTPKLGGQAEYFLPWKRTGFLVDGQSHLLGQSPPSFPQRSLATVPSLVKPPLLGFAPSLLIPILHSIFRRSSVIGGQPAD